MPDLPVVKVRSRKKLRGEKSVSKAKRPAAKVKRSGSSTVGENLQTKVTERKELMLFHLSRSHGNVVYACDKVGISRMTHYRWLASDATYAEATNDIAEGVVDRMESLFIKTTVEEKDLRSMRWFLERKGRDRGYGKPTVMALDGEGNPVGYGGNVQNNVQINFKSDVPADSLRLALSDLLKQNPRLLETSSKAVQEAEVVRYVEATVDDDRDEEEQEAREAEDGEEEES
jgi:hypothetical protein